MERTDPFGRGPYEPPTRAAWENYAGPIRKASIRRFTETKQCIALIATRQGSEVRCDRPTINGEWWCYACKDPDGHTDRLRQAQVEARQRCAEAYPAREVEQCCLF